MSITVLGTIFNVKSHPYDQTDLVEVKEGKVQVDLPEAMMRISSGEHVIINKFQIRIVKKKILWKNLLFGVQEESDSTLPLFKMWLKNWNVSTIAK